MRKLVVAGIGALLIPLAGCATTGPATTGAHSGATSTQHAVLATSSPSPTPSAAPSTTPPATVAALPRDQVFQGYGDKVVRLSLDSGYVHMATITYRGSDNFVVESLDDSGQLVDLVVNTIGNYSGVRPLDFRETPVALKITASGSWKIVVQVAQEAPLWTGSSSGRGSAVLRVDPDALDGLTTVTITFKGDGNFVVSAYGDNGDLLVNEIGSYSGETLIPAGTVVLEIQADGGTWTISKS